MFFFITSANAVQIKSYEQNNSFTPVSITRCGENCYIAADYKHLYQLKQSTEGTWYLKELPIIDPQNLVGSSNRTNGHFGISAPGNYNPTGVYYSTQNQKLYIANYTGHNILIADIKNDPPVATITKNFLHPQMKSPENVFVDSEKGLMAIADYDGSAIFLFDLEGQLKWKTTLGLAHGVLIDGDFVYATGLSNTPLAKLDLKNGLIIKENKQVGIQKGQTLYPTQVVKVPGKDHIAVINTNSGRIVIYDYDFNYVSELGSMGPKPEQFYRPYGIYFDIDKVLVADSQKNRIAIISHDLKTMSTVGIDIPTFVGKYVSYGNGTPYCSYNKSPDFILDSLKYAYTLPEGIELVNGYQTLCLLTNHSQLTIALLPWMSETYKSNKRTYIPLQYVWSKETFINNRKVAIFGSPGQNSLLIIDNLTSTLHKAELPRGVQVWGPDESPFFNYIESLAVTELEKFDQHTKKCNGNTLATFVIESTVDPNLDFEGALTSLFHWEQKTALLQTWKNNKPLKGFFSNWVAKGGQIVIEDALLLKLMNDFSYQKTLNDFEVCKKLDTVGDALA